MTRYRPRLRRVVRIVASIVVGAALGFVLLSLLVVGLLRFVDPPTSAFILRHALLARLDPELSAPVRQPFVRIEDMATVVPLAVVAAEDQRFPQHRGFDLIELRQAWEQHQAGGRLRGASTLSQQTAKNLFLWPGRDALRKGLEAWFTVLIEWLWPKPRILEVYLNIAQFGPDTYGIGAASWRYFERPPIALTRPQAARLAAALPNPRLYRLDAPSARMQRRAAWIEGQMRQLGGPAYLQGL